jgi:hypothetical protein
MLGEDNIQEALHGIVYDDKLVLDLDVGGIDLVLIPGGDKKVDLRELFVEKMLVLEHIHPGRRLTTTARTKKEGKERVFKYKWVWIFIRVK